MLHFIFQDFILLPFIQGIEAKNKSTHTPEKLDKNLS